MCYTYKNCPFKGKCARENHKPCDGACNIIAEFAYLVNESNLPQNYRKSKKLFPENEDIDSFYTLSDIKKDILAFTEEGRQLYLYGNTGCSKTSWACKMCLTYMALIASGNGFNNTRCFFLFVPTFLAQQKDFDDNEKRKALLNKAMNCDLVVIDDIGAVMNSNYDITVLTTIIDNRTSNGLATIYTSNLSIEELAKAVGVRIADRISSDIVIKLLGKSRRNYTNIYQRKGE